MWIRKEMWSDPFTNGERMLCKEDRVLKKLKEHLDMECKAREHPVKVGIMTQGSHSKMRCRELVDMESQEVASGIRQLDDGYTLPDDGCCWRRVQV